MHRLSLIDNIIGDNLSVIVASLLSGGIVAYPTESYYALGVKADHEGAVRRLYQLKRRPSEKAIPILISDPSDLGDLVRTVPSRAYRLMQEFWPGALTLVFRSSGSLPPLLLGGTDKVALRVPGQGFALDLVRASGFPVTATSANVSGQEPARDADHVIRSFGDGIDIVADLGPAPGGKPSTIIDVTTVLPSIIREGRISTERVMSALGRNTSSGS